MISLQFRFVLNLNVQVHFQDEQNHEEISDSTIFEFDFHLIDFEKLFNIIK